MFTQATAAFSVVGSFGAIAGQGHLSNNQSALPLTAFGATFVISASML